LRSINSLVRLRKRVREMKLVEARADVLEDEH